MGRSAYPWRIGGPAAASLLVNALLIAALLNLGMGSTSRRTESPALTVMSLAALKGAEDGEEEADAAVPVATAAPAPPVEHMLDQPRVPAVQLVLPPATLPKAMPAMPAAPAEPATSPSVQSAPQSMPTTSPAGRPARWGAADGLDVKAPPGTGRSYAAKVRSWLYAHKIYPRRARMRREEGKVQVRFVLDRAGVLIEGVIIQKSGNGALDEEAIAMMRRASPFPKAPVDVPGEKIEFSVPIEFILPV